MHSILLVAVGVPDLSPLTDRTLMEVAEMAYAMNKGGTALLTPFADRDIGKGLFCANRGKRSFSSLLIRV